MLPPTGKNIGSLLMVDADLPRRPNGDPYQVLFRWDDESGEKSLALSADGQPLVWAVDFRDTDNLDELQVEVAVPAIAKAAREWLDSDHA